MKAGSPRHHGEACRMRYDVAVLGLGAMGSAAVAHCAGRGASVIGLEQFGPAHEFGSSSGKSRMIRKAYFEDAAYVPLLLRAYELWRALEDESGQELLRITGLLMVGTEDTEIITGARRAAEEHDLKLEVLAPRDILERYPTLLLQPDEIGLFETDGGVLVPERAIEAHLGVAARAGAQLLFGVAVTRWEAEADDFTISLTNGSRISAKAVILTMGPWLAETFGSLGISLRIQRNLQAWFTPATNAYSAARFPPFLLDRVGLAAPLYGFPDFGDGVKAAFHAHGGLTTASGLDRTIDPTRDVEPIVTEMERWMPGAAATFRAAKPCPYSLTPDGHFVIDRHPQHPRAILCGGFSGHGFKFAPVVGEIAADLALEGASRHAIDFLSLRRFADGPGSR